MYASIASKLASGTPSSSVTRPPEITSPGSGSCGERSATSPSPGSSRANPSRFTRWASMNRTRPTGRSPSALIVPVIGTSPATPSSPSSLLPVPPGSLLPVPSGSLPLDFSGRLGESPLACRSLTRSPHRPLDRGLGPQLDHPSAATRGTCHATLTGGSHHDAGAVGAEQVMGELDRLVLGVGGGAGDGQQGRPGRHVEDHRLIRRRRDHLDTLQRFLRVGGEALFKQLVH